MIVVFPLQVSSIRRPDVDDFDTDAIRRTVYQFYEKKEYPTLYKLVQVLRGKELLEEGRISLWKLLRKWDLDTRLMISVRTAKNYRSAAPFFA